MDNATKDALQKCACTIKSLSVEAVEKANSGHPGLPLGCAEFGAFLYGSCLRHNPKEPNWVNRDRVILSAGHGSAWLYSCLHLAGFNLSMEELKNFRQLHSVTPGHPEYHETDGVESTTGPLGQGVGNAVGHAFGLKILGDKFNTKDHTLFDGKVYCLAGDGCLQEGVSAETSAFAAHYKLNNFVLIHDKNSITLDGPLSQSCSEDTIARYKAYGFETYELDGYDFDAMEKLFLHLRDNQTKPAFISMTTIIGHGSPNKAGTHKVHGSPLGKEELALTKKALGLPDDPFHVPDQVTDFFKEAQVKGAAVESKWQETFNAWKSANPDLFAEYEKMHKRDIHESLEKSVEDIAIEGPIAGRSASQAVLTYLGDHLPFMYGGSADLSGSDCTMMKQFDLIEPGNYKGRNIKYGIREFGMATIASGLFQTGMIFPFIGTFLTFSDYMRNAIRLASLSKYHVIYQFTHDSIFLGEDGPTHQPVEHYASLRAIPNLHVFRPADAWEVKGAWIAALKYQGPSAIILTRQKLPVLEEAHVPVNEGVGCGAYILKKEKGSLDVTLFATGSEVSLALEVAGALEEKGKGVRVVSMPCWELFEAQDKSYQESILGGSPKLKVSIEAGIPQGWHKWVGSDGLTIAVETFGLSAPMKDLAKEYGFTKEAILERISSKL